ncbi:hypothetical protein F4821DRAFT_231485 [Hypoxylon rubiginosum]|uniref:Uncharacterized protein n=1 Tax=Hypoxylon rubiginosum TaxID=110542 RepID=A0ACC0D9C9_9PEZI|nr:hypothetical protein F4821DRAFT_231485 [Hypoxylon rubiginosum]
MYARSVLSVFMLAACALSSPINFDRAADNTCVLIDGDDPYVLDPFNRPQCACKCIKLACEQSTPEQTELCLRTSWPYTNGTTLFPDTLGRYATCVGGTHCVG